MIEIKQLTKMYGAQRAVDEISFQVEQGEIVGFLGPNGAGKSTTMKIVCCYVPPTSGEVTVGGMSVDDHSLEVRRMIGYLAEQNPLYVEMNVVDFLRYVAELRDVPKNRQAARIGEIVEICGLGEVLHKDIGQLSKGYKQRVGLGQAMIHDPEILILDEPTIGLDPNQVVDIRNLIKRLGREKTVVLSTHILSEVQATCSRAVIIHRGKIVADDTLSDLQIDLAGKQALKIELLGAENGAAERLQAIEGVEDASETYDATARGKQFRVTAAQGADPREAIFSTAVAEGWTLIGMTKEVRSLEEVFHQLTMN